MHKIFGDKCEVSYVDRKGAYIIPSHNGKLGVVQTSKGFFFLGGGIDENETDIECNQLPRCKHSSTVLGSYVAAHSTCLSSLQPQGQKRGMKVSLFLPLHILEHVYLSLYLLILE